MDKIKLYFKGKKKPWIFKYQEQNLLPHGLALMEWGYFRKTKNTLYWLRFKNPVVLQLLKHNPAGGAVFNIITKNYVRMELFSKDGHESFLLKAKQETLKETTDEKN
jgi:hypothetical protein